MHIAGDLVFFILIWPNDAGRALLSRNGVGTDFWLEVLQLIVFTGLALVAFQHLRTVVRSVSQVPSYS